MKNLIKKFPTRKVIASKAWQWKWPLVGIVAIALVSQNPQIFPGGLGVGSGTSTVTTTEEDLNTKVVKKTKTTTTSPGKSLWDVLELLVVPVALAFLGAWLQQSQRAQAEKTAKEQRKQAEKTAKEQRKQAEKTAKEQREQDADEAREEVLQRYFDRISTLLIDKNLMAIAIKGNEASPESKEILEASLDIIRARTLSILRRFEDDIDRKSSVIRFLAEADIISKLKLDLQGANLEKADLVGADLVGAELQGANLQGADLFGAHLHGAILVGAKLQGANLFGANLHGAILHRTYLGKANLSFAKLQGAHLVGADLQGADLDRAYLDSIIFNEKTLWPTKEEVAKAKNVPIELQEQLGLIPQGQPEPPQ